MRIELRPVNEYLEPVCTQCGAHVSLVVTLGEDLPKAAVNCRECGTSGEYCLTCTHVE